MRSFTREPLRTYVFAAVVVAIIALLGVSSSLRMRGLLLNTTLLALGALAIGLPLGGVLGMAIGKTDLPGRRLAAALLLGLAMTPLYVQAAAWQAALGTEGWLMRLLAPQPYAEPWLRGWFGAIWVHGLAATAWAALFTAVSLRGVERQIEEESLLDARPWQVLWRVSLRRGAGGLFTAAIWTIVLCGTEIAVTDLFAIRTFAEEVYIEASLGSLSGPVAAAPAAIGDDAAGQGFLASDLFRGVLIFAALLGLALQSARKWLPADAAPDLGSMWRWTPRRGRWALTFGLGALLAAIVCVPIVSLCWKAGVDVQQVDGELHRQWSATKLVTIVAHSFVEHRREWGWSLGVGALVATACVVVGAVAAWAARESRLAAWALVTAAIVILATPAPMLGVWTIRLLNQPYDSPLAGLTWLYDHTIAAPALVQFVRVLPLAALFLASQFATVPQSLLDAAASEGAGPVRRFWHTALPLRWPMLAAAGAAAMVVAIGEVAATLLVYPPGVTPLSVRVFQLLHYGVDDRVAALSLALLLSVLSFFMLIAWIASRLGPSTAVSAASWRSRAEPADFR